MVIFKTVQAFFTLNGSQENVINIMLPNVGQADNLGWLHHFHYLLLDNWLGDNALASAAFTVCQTERRRGRRRSPHFHLNVKLGKKPKRITG